MLLMIDKQNISVRRGQIFPDHPIPYFFHLGEDLKANIHGINEGLSLLSEKQYTVIFAIEEQRCPCTKGDKGSPIGSKNEAEDRFDEGVERKQKYPICNPFIEVTLGVYGAEQRDEVMNREGEREQNEEDKWVSIG